jgi:branched-chain amino acid transport system permease protein
VNKPLLDFATRHRVLLCALVLATLPWVLPYQALAVNILVFGLFAVGFNLLFGYTGLLSFGHAAFLGSGGYAFGVAMVHFGWPWWLALPFGVLFSMLVGLMVGALAIRTRGIYFSMVTLALGQCIYTIAYQAESLTGGENGLRGISIAPLQIAGMTFDIVNPLTKFYFIWLIVVLARRHLAQYSKRSARTNSVLPHVAITCAPANCLHLSFRPRCAAWLARYARCTCRSCRLIPCIT